MKNASPQMIRSLYEILGLPPGATLGEVHQAYRDLALVWHPDRFQDHPRLKEKAHGQFAAISRAHTLLVQELEGNLPAPAREPVPVAAPRPNPEHPAAIWRPIPFDAANVLFVIFIVWSFRLVMKSGDPGPVVSLCGVPILFAAAYNIVPAARGRLRSWYVGVTVAFFAGSFLVREVPVSVATSDFYRGETFSGGTRHGTFSASEPYFSGPGELPRDGGGEGRAPSGPEPPAPPVPPERPVVMPARP